MLIKITFDRFVEMLEERRSVFCPNGIDDCVWNYYIGLLRDNEGCDRLTNNDPQIIVDNLFVNGNFGYRVSNEVGEIVRANQKMINDIARYL